MVIVAWHGIRPLLEMILLKASVFLFLCPTHSALLFIHVFIFTWHLARARTFPLLCSAAKRWLAGCRVCCVLLWSEKAAHQVSLGRPEREKSRQKKTRERANNIYPGLLFCLRRCRKWKLSHGYCRGNEFWQTRHALFEAKCIRPVGPICDAQKPEPFAQNRFRTLLCNWLLYTRAFMRLHWLFQFVAVLLLSQY